LTITRRAFTAALTLTGLAALTGLLPPLRLITSAMAQSASDVAKPVSLLFRQQGDWVMKNTTDTLIRIGKQAGFSQDQVEKCLQDQDLLNKIGADQAYATSVLKVDSTPTFFINGERIKGEASFDEFKKKIDPLLGEQAAKKDAAPAKEGPQATNDRPQPAKE